MVTLTIIVTALCYLSVTLILEGSISRESINPIVWRAVQLVATFIISLACLIGWVIWR